MSRSRIVFTIARGEALRWMFDLTLPLIKKYADKCGAYFFVVDDSFDSRGLHHCYLKQAINLFRYHFDDLLYIDADIVPTPDAPDIFAHVPPEYLGIVCESARYVGVRNQDRRKVFAEYVSDYNLIAAQKGHYSETIDITKWDGNYYNAGLFRCSFEPDTNPHRPPIGGIMATHRNRFFDQDYLNAMICKHQLPIMMLGDEWNRLPDGDADILTGTYFAHYAGAKEKMIEDADRIRAMQ